MKPLNHPWLNKWVWIIAILVACSCQQSKMTSANKEKAIATQRPALIPLPQNVQWNEGYFQLKKENIIAITDSALLNEALQLKEVLRELGLEASVHQDGFGSEPAIRLTLDAAYSGNEAYTLSVTPAAIRIRAADSHGVFNAIQTLRQAIQKGNRVPSCKIEDRPAFDWRGFMVDVGRNFQSMPMLKEQIDVMARYKLNVFHFHATEDIAWRFESKLYPGLTAAENMLRDKGKFYSEKDLKELIQYCKVRHITFIPEIDMPGHSAAFSRAMKTDMQTDSGLSYVKKILNEFLDTYPVSFLHIGGDEVKITNKNFLPELIQLVQKRGVQTIGWSPGGNLDDKTIRQLWMEGGENRDQGQLIYLDSRHLYLNHMDPFEGVTTLFNRRILDRDSGSTRMKGAILCNWPDRRVAHEYDAISMNLVYPGMLAFAERTWRGGGVKGWLANIGEPGEPRTMDFFAFEDRLLQHKKNYFSRRSFPYFRQRNLVWNLYGPFDNGGDLSKKFSMEEPGFRPETVKPFKQMVGATIVLRHWWAPLIKAAVDEAAKENSTWYASTRIWSATSRWQDFWIGFYNISRSQATDSPPGGEWDHRRSRLWVNGNPVNPPVWKREGQKGDLEIPLVDEGYEYRTPTRIYLEKGWNEVLIKAPVGSFRAKEWQNPVKWMFTFVPLTD